MIRLLTGTMLVASLALAVPALAASGQCSLTDFDTFDCDVQMDGDGLTFALPDGQVFAFATVGEDEGLGYLIAADASPGQRPDELGSFMPLADKPGCWVAEAKEIEFCAMVFE